MTRIFSMLLLAVFTVCLTACMTANGALKTDTMSGLWVDQQGRLYALDADGVLGLPGRSDRFGVSWDFDGQLLTLYTMETPEKPVHKAVLTFQKKNLFSLDFSDAEGQFVRLKKSFKSVKTLEGTLFYRERIMLPADVTVSASLSTVDGGKTAASLRPANGQGQLSFRIHYVAEDFKKTGMLTAGIFYDGEPLFTVQEPVKVELSGKPSVLLHHAVPSEESSPELVGTYWRLKEVEGKAAEHFPDQPEAHLILKEKGQVTGSDGCNNFFMNWTGGDSSLTFTPGGATLRLCPAGEEQAQALYRVLPAVDSFRIKGTNLELLSRDSVKAVFEAVAM